MNSLNKSLKDVNTIALQEKFKEEAERLLSLLLQAYKERNIYSAWKYWCGIYDLFEPPENATDDERMSLIAEQQKYISKIPDEAVYDITDYGKRRYYDFGF